jgi:hypothetical protein
VSWKKRYYREGSKNKSERWIGVREREKDSAKDTLKYVLISTFYFDPMAIIHSHILIYNICLLLKKKK